ncbi:competence protein ComEA [Promicromonospora umidemergens]|uniref:Helix-hairpin-helix DNA-binding motif class 1 domain-containing protein n=1 Tax=Promicromonospora umidemergens TaxID=629679 RepID=A0ABP8X5B2_9MICO|nr:helix-hairpin-helix domain-containing protein [Promicromonospora umidemergens]MCP2281306.1 competence protein ComEA [Promicromonospora umidemergens]
MQPETVQQRLPDPWPFSPVPGPGDRDGDDLPPAPSAVPAARDQPGADTDELVARLRARRSASGVAAAYAAAHGHPADPRVEHGARRWALTGTTAVVAVVAVLLLAVGVAVLSLRGDGVEPLAGVVAGANPAGDEPVGQQSGGGAESPPASGEPAPAAPETDAGSDAGPEPSGAASGLLVHVVGEVAEPGLVTVPDGARVADALQAAGGTTGKADLTAVNLARTVVDGEQLYVPRPGEPVPGPTPGTGAAPGTGAGPSAGGTVDINAADAAALEELPGVGPSIAHAIVEWRETNGPFASVDELEDVPGIGPATLDEIRDSARVGP